MTNVAEKTEIVIPITSDALSMDDFQGRRRRAQLHLGGLTHLRKFGFYRTAQNRYLPEFESLVQGKNHLPAEIAVIDRLVVIERYAGYLMTEGKHYCPVCPGGVRMGFRDFIFRPLPGGPTYRWPESLQHYFQRHRVQVPQWMPELVAEFNQARQQRLWR